LRKIQRFEEKIHDPRKHSFYPHPQSPNECWWCHLSAAQHRPSRLRRLWNWLMGVR
jgi:hypothetical protein